MDQILKRAYLCFLLISHYLKYSTPFITYPQNWEELSYTNFGKGTGKTARSQYTNYPGYDLYEEIHKNPLRFKRLTLLEVTQFDALFIELENSLTSKKNI